MTIIYAPRICCAESLLATAEGGNSAPSVIPMKMGIQIFLLALDSRFRGNDNHSSHQCYPYHPW